MTVGNRSIDDNGFVETGLSGIRPVCTFRSHQQKNALQIRFTRHLAKPTAIVREYHPSAESMPHRYKFSQGLASLQSKAHMPFVHYHLGPANKYALHMN